LTPSSLVLVLAQLELEHLRLILLQRPSCCWWTALVAVGVVVLLRATTTSCWSRPRASASQSSPLPPTLFLLFRLPKRLLWTDSWSPSSRSATAEGAGGLRSAAGGAQAEAR
jgi:hypothetical protein